MSNFRKLVAFTTNNKDEDFALNYDSETKTIAVVGTFGDQNDKQLNLGTMKDIDDPTSYTNLVAGSGIIIGQDNSINVNLDDVIYVPHPHYIEPNREYTSGSLSTIISVWDDVLYSLYKWKDQVGTMSTTMWQKINNIIDQDVVLSQDYIGVYDDVQSHDVGVSGDTLKNVLNRLSYNYAYTSASINKLNQDIDNVNQTINTVSTYTQQVEGAIPSAGTGLSANSNNKVFSIDTNFLCGFIASLGYKTIDNDTIYHADEETILISGDNTFSVNSGWLNSYLSQKNYASATGLAALNAQVSKKANLSSIPLSTHQLINDSNFITGYIDTTYTGSDSITIENEVISVNSTYLRDSVSSYINSIPGRSQFKERLTDSIANSGVVTKLSEIISGDGIGVSFGTEGSGPNTKYHVILSTTPAVTKVSELQNDAGYLTAHQSLSAYALKTQIPSVSGFAPISSIPTNVSELNNDTGYLTAVPTAVIMQYMDSSTGRSQIREEIHNDLASQNGLNIIKNHMSGINVDITLNRPERDYYITLSATPAPTNISQLHNDVGYTTSAYVTSQVNVLASGAVATNTTNIAAIDERVSALESSYSDNEFINKLTGLIQSNQAFRNFLISTLSSGSNPSPSGQPTPSGDIPSGENIPLTFTGKNESNAIYLNKIGEPDVINISYKKNDGEWAAYTIGDMITLSANETIAFSGNNDHFSKDNSNYYRFHMMGTIEADGNIQSLMNFSDSVTDSCYFYMFSGCAALTKAPQMPAAELAQDCYRNMYRGCTALTGAPELPATSLAESCYAYMFNGCSNLTSAPVLPATALVSGCYWGMFANCSDLTSIEVAFTEWDSNNTGSWVQGVQITSGTFTKPAALADSRGQNNIPTNWITIDK